MRKLLEWGVNYWRENTVKLSVVIGAIVFIFYRIGSIPRGPSSSEIAIIDGLHTHKYGPFYVWNHVLYAPYSIFLVLYRYGHIHDLTFLRSISALFGLIAAIFFLYLIWRWYGSLIATLSTGLFVSSLWFLQVSRLGGELSLYAVSMLAIILITFVKRHDRRKGLKTSISVIALLAMLYVPGMIWFVIASLIINKNSVRKELRELSNWLTLALPILSLIILAPLVWSSAHNLNILKQIFGVPAHLSPHHLLQVSYHLPLDIFVKSNSTSVFAIGHMPLLDVFSTVLVILGIYSMYIEKTHRILIGLVVGFILGWSLFILGIVPIYPALIIPSILVASGLHYLIGTWFKVFPRNPLARGVGITILSLGVVAVVWLHINQFYIAWPNTITTISTYSQHI